ncbi:MAG: oxidoreductase [Rhodospirillaceae bacterium]|nr:oxidoreductase [Rhodospirillaceae bacterium]HAA94002.1 oxidoreductase [Rhodospirillaceae bacterium]
MSVPLFTPIELGNVTLANRIVVSPMCQYSAVEGSATDWHLMHLGNYALSGAGLLIHEATAVVAEGRISHSCLGLYSDKNESALARVLEFCRGISDIPLGIQLAHAGRKGSCERPWEGRGPLSGENAWQTDAPSALAMADNWPTPNAVSIEEMKAIKAAFVTATERAIALDYDLIELHCAHGYLLHEFLSPLANAREDDYGGNLANRMRYPLEVFEAVRAAWPEGKPLGVRISATDFAEGGWEIADSVVLSDALKGLGCDYVTCSGGGVTFDQTIELEPGYQMPGAEAVKRETGMPVMAVGMIRDPKFANTAIADGKTDMVALARGFLYEPRWPWRAAYELGVDAAYPPQFERAAPSAWPEAFPDQSD